MKELKNYLRGKPHIKKVYLNEKDEWSFIKHPKFPNEVSVEEVLKSEDKQDDTNKKSKSKKSE